MTIETLLTDMAARKATDLHLCAGQPPIFRVDGALEPLNKNAAGLTPYDVEKLLQPHLTAEQKQAAWKGSGIGRVEIHHANIAVEGEVFPDSDRLAAAFHRTEQL